MVLVLLYILYIIYTKPKELRFSKTVICHLSSMGRKTVQKMQVLIEKIATIKSKNCAH